ncbi:carbon monoxide dehydrogenase [Pandoraea eparura]|jgi:carbon monoxide dehydrogenase subunit G|uniref:Carbon monoxide dehydrogenase n=1 Tax=Pandoraea eparura TaxID=2508291 RepID=A0A5E4XQE7_9BURK|nr:SRPBCC domain-containing protein [Pandoraea eparura]VVE38619.1 carbon monoxide dehydrogenase [Pandoraea eparura]
MELHDRRQLPVARDLAWIALNDPGILRGCIPGCESIERIDDTTWTIVVGVASGPLVGRWTGRITMTDVMAPTSYTLNFDGLGSAAGHTEGKATVTLQAHGPIHTLLTYDLTARVGAESAHLDTPQAEAAAHKLVDECLARLTAAIAPHVATYPPIAADGEVAAALATDAALRDTPATPGLLARWWPWIVAALILIVVLLWGSHAS